MKHISLGGLDVSRIGLGTMAMSGYYLDPTSSDAESIRTIRRALELGVTHIDTAEIYGPYANEELVGRALDGASRRSRARDEVRLRLARRRWRRSARQQPGEHPDRGRGVPEAAGHRPHRSLLPAPGRPEHPDRGHRRRPGRAGCRGKGPTHRPFRGQRRNDPPRPRRAPDRRAADRVLPVDPRSGGRAATAAARARHRLRALLAARARLPHRDDPLAPRISPTTTGARTTPASPRATSRRTSASSTRSGPSPPSSTPHRRRSRWPGCSRRATTSPRSPAPSGSPASRRTPQPTVSS